MRLVLSILLAVSPLSAAEFRGDGRGPASSPVLPDISRPAVSAQIPTLPALPVLPSIDAAPAAAVQLQQSVQAAAALPLAPEAPAENGAAALAAVFDAVKPAAAAEGDAPRVSACPFHRLLGKGSPASAGAERRPEPKPYAGGLFKFSVREFLVSTARHLWDYLRGRGRISGNPLPTRARLIPLFELALEHIRNPVRGLEALHERYGESAYARAPTGQSVFFFSHPESLSRVLFATDKKEQPLFEKSEIGIGGIAQLTGRGTIFLGLRDRWRHRSKLMRGYFMPKVVQSEDMTARVTALVDSGLDELAARAKTAGDAGLPVRVGDEMSALTMRVILGVLFSYEAPREDILSRIGPAFSEITRTIAFESLNPLNVRLSELPFLYPRRKELRQAYKTLDAFASEILKKGRNRSMPRHDLLDALLAATGEDGKPLSDAEIKNEILTLVLAGHETTSATLTWALSSLYDHPEALARLRAELDREPASPTYLDLKKGYGFLDQVIQETLRLYTPAYVLFRKAVEDAMVPLGGGGQVRVPKGAHVVLSSFVTHRRPEQWAATGFDASGFFPERFDAENLAERGLKRRDLTTFPFGFGPRMCLGQALSMLETQLIMIRFLDRFQLDPEGGPARIASDIGVKRADGFPARLRPRR